MWYKARFQRAFTRLQDLRPVISYRLTRSSVSLSRSALILCRDSTYEFQILHFRRQQDAILRRRPSPVLALLRRLGHHPALHPLGQTLDDRRPERGAHRQARDAADANENRVCLIIHFKF